MGCCNSKSAQDGNEQTAQQTTEYIPSSRTINQDVPPIVITKAHSISSSVESLPATTSNVAIESTIAIEKVQHEKPPVIIEEQTQEHQFGQPPSFEEHALSNPKATIKDVKPVVIVSIKSMSDPTLIPADEPPPMSAIVDEQWPIVIRTSTSGDKVIDIPTQAPFLTVAELKQKLNVAPAQRVKLIHLGRILQDNFILLPSTCTSNKSNTIKVSKHGVVQAMIYQQL